MPSALNPGVLVDDLVEVVDDVRALRDEFGTTPVTAKIILRTWSGGRPGDGTPTDQVTDIFPQPELLSRGPDGRLRPCGLEEEGDIIVRGISLTFTEAELYSPPPGVPATERQEFFWRLEDAHGQSLRSRDYVPSGPPFPDRKRICWSIPLRRLADRG